jgi:hypothetical protein
MSFLGIFVSKIFFSVFCLCSVSMETGFTLRILILKVRSSNFHSFDDQGFSYSYMRKEGAFS